MAVGVRWEDSGSVEDTGALNVLYGAEAGLSSTGNQFWDEDATGSSSNGFADGFGFASAAGDFDGDGFADLAASAPGKQVGPDELAGAVSVLYGSGTGLSSAGSQQWTQDTADVADSAEEGDFFGWSVASGDLNGDGFDDLTVGVPGEALGTKDAAGGVNVLYGTPAGLSAAGDQFWHQDSPGIEGKAEVGDQLGLSLGIGDFDGDGFGDLVAGAPTEVLDGDAYAGAVSVIYGSVAGLSSTGNQMWSQDSDGINGNAEVDDWFAYRVAAGDFDGDAFDDLLVSAPEEDLSGKSDAGAVNAIYGSPAGLDAAGDEQWHQDSDGINDKLEDNDEFGLAVAAGDFDGDGYADAAIGVPSEDLDAGVDAGAAAVIYGTATGLNDAGDDLWKQSSSGIEDDPEEFDLFGISVIALNLGNGPEDDLAIGVVLESVSGVDYAGAVNVIYGSPSDLTSTGDQFWHQDSAGVLDSAEFDDEFGYGMAGPAGGDGAAPGDSSAAGSWAR